jgi:DNA gyrase subunit A
MSDLPPDDVDPATEGALPDGAAPDETVIEIPASAVEPIEIQAEMERSFLDYAMSVIVARALPDVRDGLKPVHRRILWDMEQQNFRPDRPFVKCARVTGDTMAKYHPHGNSAIYDALVRMAQPFSLRHPLVDFHGNYGSPDFGPAAERYTECRLAPIAMRLLADIDENTVDFTANYDAQTTEPVVLPARFPNLLVNGSQGIAVGMATNIPPHNLGEVIDATVHLLSNPDASPDDLMRFVKGPDFPTGGLILGRAGIAEAYRTGRGSVKMRATAVIEEAGKRGDRYQIVVTELPYQTSCNAIAERTTELVSSGELTGIDDVNDESSDKVGTRLVFTLKRDANPNVVLNNLYKLTQLQTSFAVNMVALVDGVPRTLNLRDALVAYVAHQIEVITRRSEHRLGEARHQLHIQEGLARAINVIDEIIALVRASEDRADARARLVAEPYSFSEDQANHILDMRLGQLTRLSRVEIEERIDALRATVTELEAILADEGRKRALITEELTSIRADFATPRRAQLTHDVGEIDDLDLIDDKELVVVMTGAGYIKSVEANAFRTQARGGRGVSAARLKDEDLVRHLIHTTAHAYLLFFTNRGRVYRLRAHVIPERERAAKGMPIPNLLPLQGDEQVQAIIDTREIGGERYLFFVTREGTVKRTSLGEYASSRRDGLIAVNLRDGDELVRVVVTSGSDEVMLVSRQGMAIRFDERDVRSMGRDATGVRGMRLRDGDSVVGCDLVRPGMSLLIVTGAGYGKRTDVERFSVQGRGGQGVMGIRLTSTKGVAVVAAFMVGEDDEIMAVTTEGVTIRIPVREISSQGRDATGVRVMSIGEGQSVASVAPILAGDDAGEGSVEPTV